MKSPESPYFSPPNLPAIDHPLSMKGRFGRLSFIAWSTFLHFIFLFGSIALGLSIDIVNIATLSVDPNWLISIQGLASIGVMIMILAYLYFALVVTIRRLHDMDRSGWWALLLLIPLVNIFVWLYIVFGPGDRGVNQYGPARLTLFWEKVLAWLMIILTLLSLLGSLALFGYMSGGEQPQTPAEMMQKTTKYF
ncbi:MULTISPECIES: DUF805 domain-containing protein [unclassified Acinetobacter]|uniref:DUF805 domain-containing protein n=1 Tax=unclassified Acinetobacter TaxID=196816 RepID=UPI001C24E2AB|nr:MULTISPECIES: DUF805 domain-containing protein [unclassified Acinetobacter]